MIRPRLLHRLARRANRGITLIELMIALVIGLLVVGAVIAIYGTGVKVSKETLQMMRLNQDLRWALYVVASDLRRSGYWANAQTDVGSSANTNPFMDAANGWDLFVGAGNECILYTYDANENGALDAGTPDERFGFRFNSSNNTLEMRTDGQQFACDEGNWAAINDASVVELVAVSFTPTNTTLDVDGPSGSATLRIREIDVGLTGRLTEEPSFTRTLTRTIRVRNDKFIP